MIRKLLFAGILLAMAGSPALCADPPVIFFTDLVNGPNSGGETVGGFSGAYVTLYGNFFGASQGGSTITWNSLSCLRVVSWGTAWRWYQKIIVQLGSSCTAATGNFVVVTSAGTSNGMSFTVGSGSILFVATTGNDSNSGSFAAPWLTIPFAVQTSGTSAGNIIYVEDGVSNTADDAQGWSAALTLRQEWCKGTASQRSAIVAYPGATVQIGPASGFAPTRGIRTTDQGATGGACAGGWVIAGIKLRGQVSAQFSGPSGNWRIVGNDVSNAQNDGTGVTAGGGAALDIGPNLDGTTIKVFGNYMHDLNLGTTDNLQQGLYPSTDANHTEIGWNEIFNAKGRAGLQTHSSPTFSGTGFVLKDIQIHDNIIHGTAEESILLDTVDPSADAGGILVYNNVLYSAHQDGNTSRSTMYQADSSDYNTGHGVGSGTVQWYNNTIYCSGGIACFRAFFEVHSGQALVDNMRNNLIRSLNSVPYWDPGLTTWNPGSQCTGNPTPANCPNFTGSNNLIFGNGAATFTNILTSNVNSDPLFVNPGADFHLQTGSPAIGAGVAISGLVYDIDGRIRPSPPSIGAYELGGGGAPAVPPACAPVMFASLLSLIAVLVMWKCQL